MFFADLTKLHLYLDGYCFALFRKIDEEMVPQLHLIDESNMQSDFVKNIMNTEKYNIYLSELFEYSSKRYQFALQFDSKSMDIYYKIPEVLEIEFRSLLDTIIYETLSYINECVQGLILNEEIHERHYSDLLKQSGKRLLQHILQNEHAINPFEKFNKISSLSYEKSFSDGKILLLNTQASQALASQHILKPMVHFETKIPLSNTRHIRKILELSNSEVYLVSDGEYLHNTVEFKPLHDSINHFFTIEFNNYFSWQLTYNGNKLMQITHEEVFIPKPKVSFFSFSTELKKVFQAIESKKVLNLYRLILEALKQPKGTIIVVSKNARSEAFRLRNQGFLIDALSLSPSIIRSITSIDGAVLMDLDGTCHGIGVILDGIATEKGDPSRGARYNSAIRYVETINKTPNYSNCFAVVISEDGDVDMVSHFLF
ncbi:diadenylate cyclase [Fusibacter bizertensis]|uniref:Diadenylate cyclase n=1 Tax=Fusibacter bizertensis TaxID=1488331 RepID=A0ABT6NBF1_9FIRM|nr:diadenylate cyclase [Fusibacter bizertensis]MDH8677748.1 diadenylate cyclase [Fusibacter bizertensis]